MADVPATQGRDFDEADAGFDPISVSRDGAPTERSWVGDQEVIVHHDDIPDCDITTVMGIPCTTALRTVIDIAPEVDRSHRERIVRHCLERRLFTVEEAWTRLTRPDLATRAGAELVRRVLPT
jgi:hypothetical protein